MLKSIMHTILTSILRFAWKLVRTREHIVAFAESWELHEANEKRAGFVELAVWRTGTAVVRIGVALERSVDRFALWVGFSDGDVTGVEL
jgi:hypothetical protein